MLIWNEVLSETIHACYILWLKILCCYLSKTLIYLMFKASDILATDINLPWLVIIIDIILLFIKSVVNVHCTMYISTLQFCATILLPSRILINFRCTAQ